MLACEFFILIIFYLGTSKVEPYGNNFVFIPYIRGGYHNVGVKNHETICDNEEERRQLGDLR